MLFLGAVLVSIVLLFILSRWEHRLARSPLLLVYATLVWLLLLGILAVWSITEQDPYRYRGRPENLKIFLGAVVVWHLLLPKAAPLRRFWHGALRYWRSASISGSRSRAHRRQPVRGSGEVRRLGHR
jgi:hypothetical protein